jgi:DNA repair exonuclease SbcCD ATPase subunit
MISLLLAATLCCQDPDTAAEIKALRKEMAELKVELAKIKGEFSDLKEALKANSFSLPVDVESLKKEFIDLANRTGGSDARFTQAALKALETEGQGWTYADDFMRSVSAETYAAYKKWRNAILKVKR